ncbi:MAG: Fe-S cluster assembly protein NifU [Planctomycetota bacterium]|jgi:NifU-like protein
MWEYNEKVREHFLNPRNVGELENPDGVGEVGSIACGDALKLFIKVDKKGRIIDARFKTYGCASAIASSSALTEIIKGKTVEEALQVSNTDVVKFLGGLPEEKMHCSVMCREALEVAVANYRGEEVKAVEDEGDVVCKCFGVSEGLIRKVIAENNLQTVEEVTNYCKAGGGCESCVDDIQTLIAKIQKKLYVKGTEKPQKEKKKLTNIQKIAMIQEVIASEIRPALNKDGGDIELIDVEGDRVFVALRGTCSNCPSAGVTLRYSVEQKLREFVAETLVVEEVKQ